MPELDKIVKLADLFGVSVDGLVRDGETPRPAAPEGAEKVVYVGWRYTAVQALGILLIAGGLLMILCSAFVGGDPLLFIGGSLAVLGLPLLLAKKHPFLIDGWVVWSVGYLLLGISHYPFMGIFSPLYGFTILPELLTHPVSWDGGTAITYLFVFAYLLIAVLTILLPVFTVRACLRRWKARTEAA